jgi:hypothetical protein
MSNDSFPKKQQRLIQSHLELNRYFGRVKEWNKTEIEARSKLLADIALTAWPYFGEDQVMVATADTVTGKIPKSVTILGQRFSVESWREVHSHTLSVIAELEPELFAALAHEYPRFINFDSGRFRRSRQLDNGYFIEVNLSSKDVYRFCRHAIESIGLSSDDWIVETE